MNKNDSGKVHVGFVGCGNVAQFHVKALKKIKQADLVAVVDINKERAKKFAEKFRIKEYYTSLSEMLENAEIDAVFVLTNPQTHSRLAIEAMNYGKHVLVEKPMCLTTKEAEEMVKAAEKNNVILLPIEQFLFTPAFQNAIKLIFSGRTGQVNSIYTYASISPLVEELSKNALPMWINTLPGGIYHEEIPHSLYTTLKILNEPIEKVYVSAVGKGESGALPFLELRILLESKNKSARIIMTARSNAKHTVLTTVINCEKCTLLVDPPLNLTLTRDYSLSRSLQAMHFIKEFLTNITRDLADISLSRVYKGCSFKIADELFIKSILENRDPPIKKEEAKEWVRITELIWQNLYIIP
jgi:predicted dehydrogenase